jgi:alpha-L-rhamnosidase
MQRGFLFLALISLGIVQSVSAAESPAKADQLRCEYRVDPLGIDVTQPRLCWQMKDARRGAKQTAYQVLVASTPEKLAADDGDLWDSGRIETNQTTQVVYAGKPLVSRMRCHWKVRLWDADAQPTPYSQPALWTMGLLKPEEIKAKWIGLNDFMSYPDPTNVPPPTLGGCQWVWAADPGVSARQNAPTGEWFFRGYVTVPEGKSIRKAQFLIVADDAAELFVNGQSVGSCANYNVPLVMDVASQLKPGKNSLAVLARNSGPTPAALAGKLEIVLNSGESIIQSIDNSWKGVPKPETNWNTAGFDDSKWPAIVVLAKIGESPWGDIKSPTTTRPCACPLFRKEFHVAGSIRRATVYGSALGIYQLHINGRPVGDDYFTPDWA